MIILILIHIKIPILSKSNVQQETIFSILLGRQKVSMNILKHCYKRI